MSEAAAPLRLDLDSGRPCVMGVLNVTPDSFSDGGLFADTARAVDRARLMADQGAGIIDIGGESTRPGHVPLDEGAEAARVLPVFEALHGACPVPLSIDTTKPEIARQALRLGATVVNDQWGLQRDPAMAGVAADAGAQVIVMHNRVAIDPALDIEAELLRFFSASLAIAACAGIAEHRVVLDPGIGFGKSPTQQLGALSAIPALVAAFGRPVLVGVSRKSFLGRLTGAPVERRLPETIAANLAAFVRGARIFRVHDVAEHVAALTVFAALAGEPR